MKRRKALGKSFSSNSIFSSKIVCADCGSILGPKVWHSTDKYRTVVWQCNHKFDKEIEKCRKEAELIATPVEKLVGQNASVAQGQDEYREKYEEYSKRYEEAYGRYQELTERKGKSLSAKSSRSR